ncbi:GTP cyclohydrolase I FolE2 [Candidatus Marinamargulisbacteria bacterium SCGC AAA071-K20]|nr:GTP cyclohydrolase I FolE2 [Candidatus Marinamargulisbacteria bacterium SCGC AAA071-K20]
MTKETNITTSDTTFPDVASDERSPHPYTIEKVGMRQLQIPILIEDENGNYFKQSSTMNVYVDLIDPFTKGIHMSRLYNTLVKHFDATPFSLVNVESILKELADSQGEISSNSFLKIAYDHVIHKPALLSQNKGWRYYPVSYDFSYKNGLLNTKISFEVTYSSTCPCSAALSRQLLGEKFKDQFSEKDSISPSEVKNWLENKNNMGGVPHAQRSVGSIMLRVNPKKTGSLTECIEQVESAIQTPVQAAVKREDEQEFARLNAENLMFCEDSVRLIKHLFESKEEVLDYKIEVEHYESLHPHNAVAIAVKGLPNGYR